MRYDDDLEWVQEPHRTTLLTAMRGLSDTERSFLRLRYVRRLNRDQMSAEVGLSHNGVNANLHQARRRLVEEMIADRLGTVTRETAPQWTRALVFGLLGVALGVGTVVLLARAAWSFAALAAITTVVMAHEAVTTRRTEATRYAEAALQALEDRELGARPRLG